MKTSSDPRHQSRIQNLKQLFSYSFQPQQKLTEIQTIIDHLEIIDQLLQQAAPEWPLDKINKIDLAILRLAVYEILYQPEIPFKVSIDEAVELAKEFGSESSPAFVNGVLGTIVRHQEKSTSDKEVSDHGSNNKSN